MLGEYFSALLNHAFGRSIRLTDQLSIVAAVAVPAAYRLLGQKMPEDVGDYIALGVLTLVLAGVGLRLIAAPYQLWRKERQNALDLAEQLAQPERKIREIIVEDIARTRIAISEVIGKALGNAILKHKDINVLVDELGEADSVKLYYKLQHDDDFISCWREFTGHMVDIIKEAPKPSSYSSHEQYRMNAAIFFQENYGDIRDYIAKLIRILIDPTKEKENLLQSNQDTEEKKQQKIPHD